MYLLKTNTAETFHSFILNIYSINLKKSKWHVGGLLLIKLTDCKSFLAVSILIKQKQNSQVMQHTDSWSCVWGFLHVA